MKIFGFDFGIFSISIFHWIFHEQWGSFPYISIILDMNRQNYRLFWSMFSLNWIHLGLKRTCGSNRTEQHRQDHSIWPFLYDFFLRVIWLVPIVLAKEYRKNAEKRVLFDGKIVVTSQLKYAINSYIAENT